MKNFWKKYRFVVYLFLIWRIGLFAVAYLATLIIPRWGGWFPYADRVLSITGLPSWIWGFGNFDGVHYLKIAQNGYTAAYSQAFFPLYPLLVRFFNFFPVNITLDRVIYVDPGYFNTGLIVSNLLFLLALLVLYSLFRLDYSEKVTRRALIILLAFPTSYYFGAVYTESLFLLLLCLAVYLVRLNKLLPAAIAAGLASVTRITGILLLPLFLVEVIKRGSSKNIFKPLTMIWMFIACSGLLGYMYYLYRTTGDPILFLNAQPMFGAERSSLPFILLPQVLYRYLKIFFHVPVLSLSFLTAFNEMVFTLVTLTILFIFVKRLRFSYWLFIFLSLIIPTLTGTLSSMPRYALMAFLLIPAVAERISKKVYISWMILSLLMGGVLVSLFTRGYWVA